MSRYIFDTNSLVSAALFENSLPGRAFRAALSNGRLLVSRATLSELADVLRRPKFDVYLTIKERAEFYRAYVFRAKLVTVDIEIEACRDPTDDKFLALAVQGEAKSIITGDPDLLDMHPFRGVSILSCSDFIEAF